MNRSITTSILALAFSATLAYAQEPAQQPAAKEPTQQNAQENALQQDPQIVRGKLGNGLGYIIRPTKEPAGRGSVRLFVHAGSMDESPETSGISHFLEHMVFNGSRTFERGELIPTMQKLGLGFGGDANAYTSFLQTVYMLDLPNLKEETVDFALTIMRDFADGATLSDDAIDHERGIVVSELKARDSESYRAAIATIAQLTEGTRVANYTPIGKEEVIRNVGYDTVRKYYREHYVPERMELIITGDFDPQEAEKWIRQHFDSMEKRQPLPRPWAGERPDPTPNEAVVSNKEQAHVTMSATIIAPYEKKEDTFEQRVKDMPLELAEAMLNLRLSRIAQQANAPFMHAGVSHSSVFDVSDAFGLSVAAEPGKWKEGLGCAEQELRKAIQYGFYPNEFEEIIASCFASFSHASESWSTVTADAMASSLVENIAEHTAMTTPMEDMRVFQAGLQRILANPDLCRAALEKAYQLKDKAKLSISGAIPEGVTAEALRRTFNESAATKVQKPAMKEAPKFAYDKIGEPGSIVQQAFIEDIGVTTLTLSNGVKVNLKPLDFKKGGLTVIAAVDGGALKLPDKPGLAMAANSVMNLGGLEAHDIDELKRIMLGHNVDLNFSLNDTRLSFSGGTTEEDLELQCKLLAAAILHPGFKQDAVALMKRNLPSVYRRLGTTPQGAYAVQAPRALYGNDTRFTIPARQEVEAVTLDDIRNALSPALQHGALEVTLVGDFDVQKALPILERTFGAMPQRAAEFEPLTAAQREVRFEPWGQRVFFRYPTELDKTIVSQVRPAGDGMDKRRNRRLQLLASIVRERLFDGIRAAMGESYSPTVKVDMNHEHPNAATITTASAGVKRNREKVNAAMDSILAGIGQGDITQEEFECALRPMIAQTEKALRSAPFWCANVSDLQSNSERLALLRDVMDDVKSITYEEIRDLGKEIFGKDNANYFFTVPEDYQPAPEPGDEKKNDEAEPQPEPEGGAAVPQGVSNGAIQGRTGAAAPLPVPHYVVLITQTTAALPEWKAVADALAAKYEGAKLIVLPELTEDACAQALRQAGARYAAYVLRPEEAGRTAVNHLHRAARKVDDDPWGDCIWGIVTGYDAAAAMRIANAREPLSVKRLLATTNVDSSHFEHSCCITDWQGFPVLEQSGYKKPEQTTYTSATEEGRKVNEQGIQSLFAEKLAGSRPQLLITSSHATQFNLEMPFSKGLVFPANNRLYQLAAPKMNQFSPALTEAMAGRPKALAKLAADAQAPEVTPDGTPRVWLAAGNCLLGDAANTKQSMAITALSAYTCNQLAGYTVPSWYGAGGWGTLSLFFENSNGTTLAEAWFLNNQFIIDSTIKLDPKLLDVRFNEPQIGPALQLDILACKPKIEASQAKDAIGLVHDRDTVAFYGDPAWRASLDCSHTPCPYTVEWHGDKQFTITANQDTRGRFAIWFPTAKTGANASGCDAEGAVFTNDFILFPSLSMKKGESKTVNVK